MACTDYPDHMVHDRAVILIQRSKHAVAIRHRVRESTTVPNKFSVYAGC